MKISKTILFGTLGILVTCTLSACTGQAASASVAEEATKTAKIAVITAPPVETPEPTPTPTPTPTPVPAPTEADIRARMAAENILLYISEDTYEPDETLHAYEVITDNPETTYALREQYQKWFRAATDALIDGQILNVKTEFTAPSWQMLSTLAYNFADDMDNLENALLNVCDFDIQIQDVGGGYSVSIKATPQNPSALFYSLPTTETMTPMGNLFTYAYLSTIYDNSMEIRDGIGTPPLEDLYFPMEQPDNWYVGDTWYAGRDSGTRRHTGTDINAPEGTALLACVDGIVLDAGTAKGTGNYIVVQGSDGTQYHYYHMVDPPALPIDAYVQTGDVVGYVGNTGNSAANHLHFTIITSDGYYLNPYTYLLESQEQTIEANNAQPA